MSTHKEYALIAILATAAVVGIMPAFALSPADTTMNSSQISPSTGSQQILPIAVSTDKSAYDRQSIVIVTGHVQNSIGGQAVTMKVSDPNGKVVEVDQITLNSNGDFQDKINTSSPLWTAGGTYTIYVQAGSQQGLLSTTTQFTLPGGGQSSCTPQQLAATTGSEMYCIDYTINGGTVSGATLDTASKALVVNIQATNDGQITLNIPRSVLDAKSGTGDSVFAVLVDGEQIQQFTETPSTDTRTITIPFQMASEKIEIIGTQIVPEFGPIAALVLAIAIISIIAVSAKTGLRFMPKY
ncbi:PEFG-CTERM sorting domain-containing protein [Candidatus Nitrosotalea okcheonensis]|uniref:Putative copper-binding protein, plastocyanin/azurin family protein n=1 Tax=Candidatus Nitrosotalea okcheonensis TaxID=1903276 RepID=A0A2H1FIB4_9ARCH|nr:PEFG-CTERM sorting domain-containing protein [Candidatus Nitrosotalea okcheonensis]SMH72464.1 putative copper-binding protein, plastocyanin/azurin family protein [Candidatus Nitrosotalea okcheonensis]